jgi:ABC-2 type transport system ATP-binding protein
VRQRVGIADALLTAPPILLLDEPTIGLDPHQVLALRDLICGMRGKHTILLSTHILTEAEAMADRILIINKGRKVAFGTAAQLKGDYAPINEIVLSVNLIPEKLLEVLKPLGCSWREPISRDGAFYRYTIASASLETSQKLLQTLSKTEGVVVNEFVRPVPTLESIFVKATLQREDLN